MFRRRIFRDKNGMWLRRAVIFNTRILGSYVLTSIVRLSEDVRNLEIICQHKSWNCQGILGTCSQILKHNILGVISTYIYIYIHIHIIMIGAISPIFTLNFHLWGAFHHLRSPTNFALLPPPRLPVGCPVRGPKSHLTLGRP